MTYRQYVNLCVGHKDKILREDRFNRDLLYYTIKGWADPKKFKMSKEKFWHLEGDEDFEVIIPTQEELVILDRRFRSLGGNKKWQVPE